MNSTCRWVNQIGQQCGQPFGHMGNHGNGLLTTPRDEWYDPQQPKLIPKVKVTAENYQLREGDFQCPWQGVIGRCILRVGHFPEIPHQEDHGEDLTK